MNDVVMSSRFKLTVLISLLPLILGGCLETTYKSYEPMPESEIPVARNVYFELGSKIYEMPPRCVLVLPSQSLIAVELDVMVQRAFARNLFEKVDRVIGVKKRRRLERDSAVSVETASGREILSQQTGCDAMLNWQFTEMREDHLLVWSQRRIGIEAEIISTTEGHQLWLAQHVSRRSEGGLPLSLMSLPIAAAQAAMFYADNDQIPSAIDDVVRRMLVTLPDFR